MNKLPQNIKQGVTFAIEEDIGDGDITAELIPDKTLAAANVICRDNAIISGKAWFNEVFNQIDPDIAIHWLVNDGDQVSKDSCLCQLKGKAKSLLSGERSALNFLQTLSATATHTRLYVDAIAHTKTKILDTRKTIPGLRDAQKYAVLCGGGNNHRKGLYDGILIKENHIMAAGSIENAIEDARTIASKFTKTQTTTHDLAIEIEVENLDELDQALAAGADIILLDNMDVTTLMLAVTLNHGRAKLEASGGISLENIGDIAETGVDFISIGNITKNIQAIDLSMRFQS